MFRLHLVLISSRMSWIKHERALSSLRAQVIQAELPPRYSRVRRAVKPLNPYIAIAVGPEGYARIVFWSIFWLVARGCARLWALRWWLQGFPAEQLQVRSSRGYQCELQLPRYAPA